jgi:hypothetical protein
MDSLAALEKKGVTWCFCSVERIHPEQILQEDSWLRLMLLHSLRTHYRGQVLTVSLNQGLNTLPEVPVAKSKHGSKTKLITSTSNDPLLYQRSVPAEVLYCSSSLSTKEEGLTLKSLMYSCVRLPRCAFSQ